MLDSWLSLLPNPALATAFTAYCERLPAALLVTVQVTGGASAVALVLGALLALGRGSSSWWLERLCAGLVFVGRCIPLPPLQLLIYFFFLSLLPIDATVAGIVAIGLHFTPYMAELFRSGISAIPRGQIEAALSLGQSDALVRRRVIIPLATRIMLPAIGQLVIGILLNSAFISQIGGRDITGMGRNIVNASFVTEIWLAIAFTYFFIAFPLSRLLAWLESRMAVMM